LCGAEVGEEGAPRALNHLRCHTCFCAYNFYTNFNCLSSCRDSCNPRSFGDSNLRLPFVLSASPNPYLYIHLSGARCLVTCFCFCFCPIDFLDSSFEFRLPSSTSLHVIFTLETFFCFCGYGTFCLDCVTVGAEGVLFLMPSSSGCFFFFFCFAVDFSKVWQRSCLLCCRLSSAGLVYSLE
jgi:hypothetical protein